MTIPNPIIPAATLALRLDTEALLTQARQTLADAAHDAAAIKDQAHKEGHAQGLAEGCAQAAVLLEDARAELSRRADTLEDTLASLVAETIKGILGAGDQDSMIRSAVKTALRRLGTDETSRLHISSDMIGPVRGAMQDLAADMPIIVDDTLAPGTALLSDRKGHAHIGLQSQLDASVAIFETRT